MKISNTGHNQTEITIDNLGTLLLSYDIPVAIVYRQPNTVTTGYRCSDYYFNKKNIPSTSKTTEKHIARFSLQHCVTLNNQGVNLAEMRRIAKFHGFNQ